ncbi:hypothetical protein [Deinococcus ruber]|uniref:Uncharacterized protein n=1 Tax=Deinococcus ruber TaxID=1848197 RepID=A0A918KWK8_9DEIO|nr:hypothetical protein [Deinococcus ruber]GGR37182.1 hypothetical protein GCM10008957_53360 [Deinococcus ruber]
MAPLRAQQLSLTESQWRRTVLLALPLAALAFILGMLLDGPSGQSTPFDQLMYPAMTVGILLLEVLLWRLPAVTNLLLSTLVISMSFFFLGKLIYILDLMPGTFSVQAEMTETLFWVPVLYVLSFFVPDMRLARPIAALFFSSVLLVSVLYVLQHGMNRPFAGVVFALAELNLANLTLLSLANTFLSFKDRLVRSEAQAETLQQLAYSDLLIRN